MNQIITHTSYDGITTFLTDNKVVAYAGSPNFIANICTENGWRAYRSPSYETGDFLAVHPSYVPEDLNIDPGFFGFIWLTVDEVLDFADGDSVMAT